LQGIDGGGVLADFKMELWSQRAPGVTRSRNDLTAMDLVVLLHQDLLRIGIGCDEIVRMADQHEIAEPVRLIEVESKALCIAFRQTYDRAVAGQVYATAAPATVPPIVNVALPRSFGSMARAAGTQRGH
jgi:hypothetical protein